MLEKEAKIIPKWLTWKRGVAAGFGGYGAYRGVKHLNNQPRRGNPNTYESHLTANVAARNISPRELTPGEAHRVQKYHVGGIKHASDQAAITPLEGVEKVAFVAAIKPIASSITGKAIGFKSGTKAFGSLAKRHGGKALNVGVSGTMLSSEYGPAMQRYNRQAGGVLGGAFSKSVKRSLPTGVSRSSILHNNFY